MNIRLAHRVELFAMNVAISAMDRTSRSGLLSRFFRQFYRLGRNKSLIIWTGAIASSAIAGYLLGYLAYFILPK